MEETKEEVLTEEHKKLINIAFSTYLYIVDVGPRELRHHKKSCEEILKKYGYIKEDGDPNWCNTDTWFS